MNKKKCWEKADSDAISGAEMKCIITHICAKWSLPMNFYVFECGSLRIIDFWEFK